MRSARCRCITLVLFALTTPLFAQDPPKKANAAPSSIEGTDLAKMLRRDTSSLLVRKTPAGAISIDVDGVFRDVLVAQIGADGKPLIHCISSEKDAEKIFGTRVNGAKEKP
jgi:hypothetical protein